MKCILAAAVGATLLAATTSAATIGLTPLDDGTVRVFGGDEVETTDGTLTLLQSGQNITNSVLEFDLGPLGASATINSMTLSVALDRLVSNLGPTAEIDIFAYGGDGAVTLADYDAPGTQVFDASIPTGGSQLDMVSFDLTDVAPFQSQLPDLVTLRLETDSFASIVFLSMEQAFGAEFSPTLTIDFTPGSVTSVPIPGALPLFAAGLAMFGCTRSRKRKAKA
ncbi:MAG: hypothetical protein AAF317_10585 [Pseudomonadota bacterium]